MLLSDWVDTDHIRVLCEFFPWKLVHQKVIILKNFRNRFLIFFNKKKYFSFSIIIFSMSLIFTFNNLIFKLLDEC